MPVEHIQVVGITHRTSRAGAVLVLDEHDRGAVVHRGLRSLDAEDANADQAEVDAAWRVEFRRRIDTFESGKVQLLDVDKSHAQLAEALAP